MNALKAETAEEWEQFAGEWVDDWLDKIPVDGIIKREPNEEDYDLFETKRIPWVFTRRGIRLYDSIVSKLNMMGKKAWPDYDFDVDYWTGVTQP